MTAFDAGDAIGTALKEARARAARSLDEGAGGIAIAHRLTDDIDEIVTRLSNDCLAAAGYDGDGQASEGGSRVAVLATGGFGRREFAPYSDLDLIFLFDKEPDERGQKLAEQILHPLWDARLDAGHAARSLREALELPDSDLTAATALLDARFLAGDSLMAGDFLRQYHAKVAGTSPGSFVARLQDEQQKRHSRFGDTIFLLEPDVKSGPGGVRDLCAGRWAASARFGSGEPFALREMKHMSPRQALAFETARDWLLKLRIALHLEAGRRQDQLRFDLQAKVAPRLYPHVVVDSSDSRSELAPAVEALMHDFQRHARTIARETTRLMLHAAADPERQAQHRRIVVRGGDFDAHFVERDGALEVVDPEIFVRRPSEMFRLFEVAIDRNLPVGLVTSDIIAELSVSEAERLRQDPDSAPRFFSVLTDVRDAARPSRLEQLNDLGLIAALMPEWEPIMGRVQYDLYHVYTVDQHSLYTVALLKTLARGEHQKTYPWPTEEIRQQKRLIPLYLSALLHDVGKGEGKNHAANGALTAAAIAARLGLTSEDVKRVGYLVREHLTMGHWSQRRDLDDPHLIDLFGKLCFGEEDRLRELFLLTFADLYCVGPGNLTTWKNELLRELFQRTRAHLRNPDTLTTKLRETARRHRRQISERFREEDGDADVELLLTSLPDRYFAETPVARSVRHIRLVSDRQGPCALEVIPQRGLDYVELVVVADDVPGLLAKITGVLFANKLDILDAAIYSRPAPQGRERGEALDIFSVKHATPGAAIDEARITSIRRDMAAVLEGKVAIESLVASRLAAAGSLFARSKPEVPRTEVQIDNEISREFTVVDVFAENRPGVLYTIAHVLFEQGLDIHRSKVAVEADRVADVFYVRDGQGGGKVVDEDRIMAIRDALQSALPDSRQKPSRAAV